MKKTDLVIDFARPELDPEEAPSVLERYLYWKEEPPERKWKIIRDVEKDRLQAIQKGAMFFTWTCLSEPFKDKGEEPNRWGDLPLDFDSKEDPAKALGEMRQLCLVHLPEFYEVDPYSIQFYASGSKGFHAIIPAKLFDAQDGDPLLPLIYKRIAADWVQRFHLNTLDLSMYSMARGKMFRIPNVKRSNGRHKVQLSLDEVRDCSIEQLLEFTMAPREIESVEVDLIESEELGRLYRTFRNAIYEEMEERPESKLLEPEQQAKLAEKLPPCISHIIVALPQKTEKINFNKLAIHLATYFQSVGWDKPRVWQSVKSFIEQYPHSETYDTAEKRISAWRSLWGYLENNDRYSFDCSYIKGLGLPASAFRCAECIGKSEEQASYRTAVLEIDDFLSLEFPPRKSLLHPIVKEGSIGMVYGPRGVGKTLLAQSITEAIVRGEPFGPWLPGTPVPCLYLEGEMPAQDVQERFRALGKGGARKEPLYIYSDAYAYEQGLPKARISDRKWQKQMKEILLELDVKFWVVDNLASLAPGVDEILKKDYDPINQFFLELRFAGITTQVIHHSGKIGQQRGTSAHEDNIDSTIKLSYPPDYSQEQGARFNVTFEKARLRQQELQYTKPLEFQLAEDDTGHFIWTYKTTAVANKVKILELLDEGLSQKEISDQLEVDKGYVSRVKKKAVEDGWMTPKGTLTQSGFQAIKGAQNEPDF